MSATFSFIHSSLCVGLLRDTQLLIRSDVALALSYLIITYHIVYKTSILIFWEEENLAYVVSTTRCIQFGLECGPEHLKGFERSDLYGLECISEDIYTWSVQDQIAIDQK